MELQEKLVDACKRFSRIDVPKEAHYTTRCGKSRQMQPNGPLCQLPVELVNFSPSILAFLSAWPTSGWPIRPEPLGAEPADKPFLGRVDGQLL